jgi:hypothetical protein
MLEKKKEEEKRINDQRLKRMQQAALEKEKLNAERLKRIEEQKNKPKEVTLRPIPPKISKELSNREMELKKKNEEKLEREKANVRKLKPQVQLVSPKLNTAKNTSQSILNKQADPSLSKKKRIDAQPKIVIEVRNPEDSRGTDVKKVPVYNEKDYVNEKTDLKERNIMRQKMLDEENKRRNKIEESRKRAEAEKARIDYLVQWQKEKQIERENEEREKYFTEFERLFGAKFKNTFINYRKLRIALDILIENEKKL